MTSPDAAVDLAKPGPTPWPRPRRGPLMIVLAGVIVTGVTTAVWLRLDRRAAAAEERVLRAATGMTAAMWEAQVACEHFLNTARPEHRHQFEAALQRMRADLSVLEAGASGFGSASVYIAAGLEQARDEFADWERRYARPAIAYRLEKGGRRLAPFLRKGQGPARATAITAALEFMDGKIQTSLELRRRERTRWVLAAVLALLGGAGAAFAGEVIHLRERRREVQVLAERSVWLESLAEFAEHVQHSPSVTQAAGLLADAMVGVAGNATVVLRDPDGSPGARIAAVSGAPAPDADRSPLLADAMACPVIRTGIKLEVADVRRGSPCVCPLGVPRAGGHLCEPLRAGDRSVGVANVRFAPDHPGMTVSVNHLAGLARVMSLSLGSLYTLQIARDQAITDPLTGVHNRRFLDGHLDSLMKANVRDRRSLGFLMLDLDHFKRFNDTHGHPAGDALLRAVATAITGAVREGDTVARYGGEEFTVLLPAAARDAALETAERIRTAVAGVTVGSLPGLSPPVVTVSMGLAVAPDDGHTAAALIAAADHALYRAKETGRNRVVAAGDA